MGYIVCALMVFSYILFDILDLDGSNLPVLLAPMERAVLVAEVPSDIEFNHAREQAGPLGDIALLPAGRLAEYNRLQRRRSQESSPLDSARAHGYRVGLARDSVSDPSPYD